MLDLHGYRIPRCYVAPADADKEYARLRQAVDAVSETLETSRLETSAVAGEQTGDIFAAQLQMLHDPRLHSELRRRISERHHSAAYAVSQVLNEYAAQLRRLNNPLADRYEDVLDIEKQLLMNLGAVTRQPLSDLTEPVIVLSHLLTPSETANLDRRYVKGFLHRNRRSRRSYGNRRQRARIARDRRRGFVLEFDLRGPPASSLTVTAVRMNHRSG